MTSQSCFSAPPSVNHCRIPRTPPLILHSSVSNSCGQKPSSLPRFPSQIGIGMKRVASSPLRASDSATFVGDPSSTAASFPTDEDELAAAMELKIGSRVRVSVPLKVYHVPKVPEIDLIGKEGVLKQYVAVWKGKRISANLPFKIQFVVDIEGRGPVKFLTHLKEDEFEFLD